MTTLFSIRDESHVINQVAFHETEVDSHLSHRHDSLNRVRLSTNPKIQLLESSKRTTSTFCGALSIEFEYFQGREHEPNIHHIDSINSSKNQEKKQRSQSQTGDEVHISGNNALIIASIIILSRLSRKPSAVATIMHEQKVAGTGVSEQIGHCSAYVLASRPRVGVVGVDHHRDIFIGKSVTFDEASVHPTNVVYASFQFCFRSWVIAPYQHCLPRHFSLQFSPFVTGLSEEIFQIQGRALMIFSVLYLSIYLSILAKS